MGISELNDMQKQSLDANKKHKDIVLLSPTGSGKTLAFLLPIIEVLDPKAEGVQALILSPSRELAIQIEQVFKSLKTGFKVNSSYGGHKMRTEVNNFTEAPAVLIGTPGRIADHIRRKSFDTKTIKTLVLDEFDKALELGFKNEMEQIMEHLTEVDKKILSSATKIKKIPEFTGIIEPHTINYLKETKKINIKLRSMRASHKDKLDILFRHLCTVAHEKNLVFCNHRDAVERISEILKFQGLEHGIFHGGMEQHQREKELIKFRNGSHNILITTDLASRGLDIPEINNVIHYQMPDKQDAYTHRNGRTARMNASGVSYLVLTQTEEIPQYLTHDPEEINVTELTGLPEKPKLVTLYINAGKKNKVNKIDIVGLFMKKGKLSNDELGKIEILDFCAFVAVSREKADKLIKVLNNEKVKKQRLRISIAN